MKKSIRAVFMLLLVVSLFGMNIQPVSAARNKDVPGVSGWKYRVDKGSNRGNENTHIHVYGPKGEEYVDGFGGKNSHKKLPRLEEAPGKVKKNVKKTKEYKDAEADAKEEIRALKELKRKNIDWKNLTDKGVSTALLVAAGVTWFFPGDDVAAWINFARAWGLV